MVSLDPALTSGGTPGVISQDEAVCQAVARGDHRQAAQLCAELHGLALGRFCMALLGGQSEAQDMAQETLLIAQQSLSAYRSESSVRAWLFGIARRRCARWLEHNRRRQTPPPADATEPAPTGEELLARHRRAQATRQALDALKPSDREALLLRYQAGLSYREIALDFAIDEAAARQRVSRALLRVSALLRQQGGSDD